MSFLEKVGGILDRYAAGGPPARRDSVIRGEEDPLVRGDEAYRVDPAGRPAPFGRDLARQASDFYAKHPTLVKTLGAAAVLLLAKRLSGKRPGRF